MEKDYVKKCFENWQMIISYIENNIECTPDRYYIELFSSSQCRCSTNFVLSVCRNGVYIGDDNYRPRYSKDFTISDVIYDKFGAITNAYHIEPFCNMITEICTHWNIIKKNIEILKNRKFTVMNFSAEHCIVEKKMDYKLKFYSCRTDKEITTIPDKFLTIYDVTEKELRQVIRGICIGLRCKYSHIYVDVYKAGDGLKLYRDYI